MTKSARVEYDARASVGAIVGAVEAAGFSAEACAADAALAGPDYGGEARGWLKRCASPPPYTP